MDGFIFGGRSGVKSPQELKERRELARALAMRNMGQQPKDLWSGLNFLASAIGNRVAENKFDKAEASGQAGATSKFDALVKALGGSGPSAATASTAPQITPASYSPSEQTGLPVNETGSWLTKQLQSDPDLKLSPAAAAGFAGNLDVETGGFKHMQEIKPTVPGSRGGFGWAQWTGPRRKQFEAWAAQNGLDPTSKEANYGFLKHELTSTPEGKVLASLQGVNDPTQAAAIVSSQYLRPGIPNIQNRVAAAQQYAGPGASTAPAQAAPVQVAQAGNGPDLNALFTAYSDPWLNDGQRDILKIYIQQQLQAADPETKLKLRKMGLEIDALENPKGDPFTLSPGQQRYDAAGNPIASVPKGQPRPATSEEKKAFGVEPDTPLVIDEDGKPSILSKGGVNIDLGDNSFDKELGKGLAGIYVNQIEQGNNAIATKAGMQQIRQLMAGKGGALDGFASIVAPYLPEGLVPEGANDVTAAQAVISGLIPKQRVAGSGSTSDFDARMFAKGLPSVWNKPGANELIADTFEAYSDYQIAVSDIIQSVAADASIKNKPAAIREEVKKLADPFARWKLYVKDNPVQPGKQPAAAPMADKPAENIGPPPAGVTPQEWKLMTPEDRALWK